MKAVVAAFNQEKALVGAFSMIVQPVVEPMEHYTALIIIVHNTIINQALCAGGLPEAGRGLVGCVAELSVGAVSAVDMLARAGRGRNVDICQHQHQHQTPRYAYP